MESHMGPTATYGEDQGEGPPLNVPSQEAPDFFPTITIEEVLSEPLSLPSLNAHYLVDLEDGEGDGDPQLPSSQYTVGSQKHQASMGS